MATTTLSKTSLESLRKTIDEITGYTHKSASTQGLLGPDEEWFSSAAITDYTPGERGNEQLLQDAAVKMAGHTQDPTPEGQQSALNVVNTMGADRIVLNALSNAYRSSVTLDPYHRFVEFFTEGLRDPEGRDDFIKALQAAKEQMVISIVQTMHPTIYHTEFARERETELTAILEEMVEKSATSNTRTPDTTLLGKAKKAIDKLIGGIKEGKAITPDKRVTVVEENTLDRFDHEQMKKNFETVIGNYNNALKKVATDLKLTQELQGCELDAAKLMEYRTWAYAADSDGREKATSLELYRGIFRQVDIEGDKTIYRSRTRDPRVNAKDQKNAVSCFIQAAARPLYDENQTLQNYLSKMGNGQTLLQNMDEEQQAALLQELVASDNHFSAEFRKDVDRIRAGTIGFNEMFIKIYKEFLDAEGLPQSTELESLRDSVSLHPDDPAVPGDRLQKLATVIAVQDVIIDGRKLPPEDIMMGGKKIGEIEPSWDIDLDNLTYEKKPYARHSQLFAKAQTGNAEDGVHRLGGEEKRKLLDVIKRLQVLNHAIETVQGNTVADRYQIAEFKNASDFYATLLLFKETGIIEMENGRVVRREKVDEETGKVKLMSPKLSIQPLLETFEDQQKAPDRFSKLLEDPLVLSYYQALGHADVMFGYSDGSKSAGNFASEWSIYKNARKLQSVFKEKGIELRVFHGRGHGDCRGGQFVEGQSQRMMAPELAMDMRYDVTLQSDLPMQMAISSSYGQDTCAGIIAGCITARVEAEQEITRMHEQKYATSMKSMETAIEHIAERSKEKYRELVANNPATTVLLETVHDNPLKSSRAPKRRSDDRKKERSYEEELKEKLAIPEEPAAKKLAEEAAAKKLGETRAITVEYGFEMADAPLNYIGMRTALQEFVDEGLTVKDATGREHSGEDALRILYENHPFFRGMLDKTEQGLNNYDPAVFTHYAKFAGVAPWANDCMKELGGSPEKWQGKSLRDLVHEIRGGNNRVRPNTIDEIIEQGPNQPNVAAEAGEHNYLLQERTTALDKTAHAFALSLTVVGRALKSAAELGRNPFKPHHDKEPLAAKIVDGISFVAQGQHPDNLLWPSLSASQGVWHISGSRSEELRHNGFGR